METQEEVLVKSLEDHYRDLWRALGSETAQPVDPQRLVHHLAAAVPHADSCGVTVIRSGQRPQSLAATSELAAAVEHLQFDAGEGPCLEATASGDIRYAADLTVETRWTTFSRRCVEETGTRSIIAVKLPLERGDRAALNVYSREAHAFTELDKWVVSLLAPFTRLAVQADLLNSRVAHLEKALESSRLIGTAIGILMAQGGITHADALSQLRRASQHLNRKLRDVAADVRLTGELPG